MLRITSLTKSIDQLHDAFDRLRNFACDRLRNFAREQQMYDHFKREFGLLCRRAGSVISQTWFDEHSLKLRCLENPSYMWKLCCQIGFMRFCGLCDQFTFQIKEDESAPSLLLYKPHLFKHITGSVEL